jgi:hypothetical protein
MVNNGCHGNAVPIAQPQKLQGFDRFIIQIREQQYLINVSRASYPDLIQDSNKIALTKKPISILIWAFLLKQKNISN